MQHFGAYDIALFRIPIAVERDFLLGAGKEGASLFIPLSPTPGRIKLFKLLLQDYTLQPPLSHTVPSRHSDVVTSFSSFARVNGSL